MPTRLEGMVAQLERQEQAMRLAIQALSTAAHHLNGAGLSTQLIGEEKARVQKRLREHVPTVKNAKAALAKERAARTPDVHPLAARLNAHFREEDDHDTLPPDLQGED